MHAVQAWQEHGFAFEWAKEAGLDVRGLRFARDVRRQLEGITGPNGSHLLGQCQALPALMSCYTCDIWQPLQMPLTLDQRWNIMGMSSKSKWGACFCLTLTVG